MEVAGEVDGHGEVGFGVRIALVPAAGDRGEEVSAIGVHQVLKLVVKNKEGLVWLGGRAEGLGFGYLKAVEGVVCCVMRDTVFEV